MKKITFLFFLLIGFTTLSQEAIREPEYISEAEVPDLVKRSHDMNFPNSFIKDWFVDRGLRAGDTKAVYFRSEFSNDGNTNSRFATYLPNGVLFYQSQFYKANNIPSPIVIQTRAEYNGYEIEHADFITLYNPKREIYRVKLRDRALVQMAYFTIDGIPIPKNDLPEELLVFKY